MRNLVRTAKGNFYSTAIQDNASNHRVLFNTVDCLLH